MSGMKLYLIANESGIKAMAYVAAGDGSADDTPRLEKAISEAQARGVGSLYLSSGTFFCAETLDLSLGARDGTKLRFFSISGDGPVSWLQNPGAPGAVGTLLLMAEGKQIRFGAARSQRLQHLAILGAVADGALLDAAEALTYRGGLTDVTVINDIRKPPKDRPVALSASALYQSDSRGVTLIGRRDFRAAFDDRSLPNGTFFFGTGLDLTREKGGTGGGFDRFNVHGFDVGFECGLSAAAWAKDPEQRRIGRVTFPPDSQFSFCNTGLRLRAGIDEVEIQAPHFEYCLDCAVEKSGGDGNVTLSGGQGGMSGRMVEGERQLARHGMVLLGSPEPKESRWGVFRAAGFGFRRVNQAGVFVHGGPMAGEVILDACTGSSNGGPLVAVDRTNGDPDILIRGWRGPVDRSEKDFEPERFVSSVRHAAEPYQRHEIVEGDARWLARIEDCGVLGEEIPLGGPLDLARRKYPPFQCVARTAERDQAIRLGDGPVAGMEMTVEKRDAKGRLVVAVPKGTRIFDGAGKLHAGPAEVAIQAVGWHVFVRRGPGTWTTTAALA